MGLSYKHFLYGAITFTSLLGALLTKGLFGGLVTAPMAFCFALLYFVFLGWAGGQLWTIHLREQQQLESPADGKDLLLTEQDRPDEATLVAAETYLSMGESLDTICLFVNPMYRNWDQSKKLAFRQNLHALLGERRSREPGTAPGPT